MARPPSTGWGGAEDIYDESVLFSPPVFQVRAYRRGAVMSDDVEILGVGMIPFGLDYLHAFVCCTSEVDDLSGWPTVTFADEVSASDLGRVEPELARDVLNLGFDGINHLRPRRASKGTRGASIRVDGTAPDVECVDAVRAGRVKRGKGGQDRGVHRVCPCVEYDITPAGKDATCRMLDRLSRALMGEEADRHQVITPSGATWSAS